MKTIFTLWLCLFISACDLKPKIEDILNKQALGSDGKAITQNIYSIQAPNGRIYEIKGPVGASQNEIIQEVLRQHPDAWKTPFQQQQEEIARLENRIKKMEGQNGPFPLTINGSTVLCNRIGVIIDCL